MPRIDAITFDFWNTLVYERPGHTRSRRLAAWLGLLEEAGIPVTEQALEELFERSWVAFNDAWKANRQLRGPDAAALMIADLGHDLPASLRDDLVQAFVDAGDGAELELTPGVADVLATLDAADVRIGIICDVGMTGSPVLRRHLDRHGVLRHFDHWSFSDEVGVYKPDRRIFEHALAGLGNPAPARTAHVGDLRATDVAGARAMGILSVRYIGVYDDPHDDELPEAEHVITGYDELARLLDVA